MSDSPDIPALLERVRAASGPDRALDTDIRRALEPDNFHLQHLTASLDAAVALVERLLPGCAWRIWKFGLRDSSAQAEISGHYNGRVSTGATPALAFIAAVLSALQAQERK